MHFNIISLVVIVLSPHLTTATPIASPRGGGGATGGGGGASAGGSSGGVSSGGGGSSSGGFSGGSSGGRGGSFGGGYGGGYTSSSSSSGSGGSFAIGALTGYVGGIWYVFAPPLFLPCLLSLAYIHIGSAMVRTTEEQVAGRTLRNPRPTASSRRP